MTALGAPVERYLEALTGRLREQLGDELVGAWLFGSGALGDFDPERSDVDVQAVTARRLPRAPRERLAAELAHDRLPCPARGLEFVVYAREDLGAREGPAFSLNLNSGPRMAGHLAFDAGDDPRFWFVLDVAIGRDNGRRLVGPAAREVFPEPPRALVLDALLQALDWYRREGGAWPQTVLAACRAWAWARDGAGWPRATPAAGRSRGSTIRSSSRPRWPSATTSVRHPPRSSRCSTRSPRTCARPGEAERG